MGTPRRRTEGPAKVTGTARYAAEYAVARPLHLHPILATVPRGRVTAIHTTAAEALDGVVAVLTTRDAEALADTADREFAVLQDDEIGFRGQYVAAVLADTSETARHGADLVRVTYDEDPFRARLDPDSGELYAPDSVNPAFATDSVIGDVSSALRDAPVTVDATYRTAMTHNNPMEPHASIVVWEPAGTGGRFTIFDSTQGVSATRRNVATVFGLDPGDVDVISPHVGGGFGSKGNMHANVVLACLAARRVPGRPVTYALTRQQMFSLVGYRTPTVQHVRLGASPDGRLTGLVHDVVEQTSRIKEFAEQTATYSRSVYAAPHRRTTHRLDPLDVPVPSWMRAPGECPGSFAAEVAMDELATACGLDPVELRIRNEPDADPESGKPFSSRHLVECLRRGVERFGWSRRDPTPRARLVDGWWTGTGVAAAAYPANRAPGSGATVRFHAPAAGGEEHWDVEIAAADIGTGARTVLGQIAADALDVDVDTVEVTVGDTAVPAATVAGGSSGTTNWGTAVVDAAQRFREKFGADPSDGDEADGTTPETDAAEHYAMSAFGAHFVEVAVHADTGEIRVPRMLGVFAAGRILNPTTARSQLLGGMTMGLSMALHEDSVMDPRSGHVVNHDLANYHIASCADVGEIDVEWIDEVDPHVNPMGSKGIGEIGIVGAAAAVANAAHHATGVRVRSVPITVDAFLG
ncbi:xanthine dehydrogenase family protein molybdopterin-binding subunit [Actinomycetospora chiangmaiensis]|uniref:xanthine dehydrogenase family protein molybdopterin-binding subunit n=1 Tax=Actinomycetospora chiangmaiensis TaxID=402650 RepID=UPI000527AB3E|nr:xanthine dehydrogenase family protein molybdopterin-binding subunit [Actinomycetospora chiangmaiensis]